MNKHIIQVPNFHIEDSLSQHLKVVLGVAVVIISSLLKDARRKQVEPVLKALFSLVRGNCVIIGLRVKPLSWVKNIDDRGYVTPFLDSELSQSLKLSFSSILSHACPK